MSVSFDQMLVVGISSRALFNLEKENQIFEKEGLEAYRNYQFEHEEDILEPGAGFPLVKKLLAVNEKMQKKMVEVIVMSRNSAETSLRMINSIDHYGLDINRMAMSGGEAIDRYLEPFGVDLFLSRKEEDVNRALKSGFPAGLIYPHDSYQANADDPIRIAFDADAVLFSGDSENIYQQHGLDAFRENEVKNENNAMKKGPMAKFLFQLSHLQKECAGHNVLRTAIVTARDKDSGKRVIKTLRQWNVIVDEVFFLQGAKKADVLKSFQADIFFDDQDVHAKPASEVVPSARVLNTD
ncbi:5'-nucleotidase [Catenisphaera adipataccumulans]|jgi:5'-nucleotidase|uniref:5'-nucleotidase n=1 Tax=Catenisphaera adipataccumulans TaxID=700500 RepID=A0A7W8CYF6_9FIRM|nr:5'-nucleotidase [Catenisphaera adipataccumulans]MBB5183691.1 5'-nucleotidase [Catenisphaera adipataccumulans]